MRHFRLGIFPSTIFLVASVSAQINQPGTIAGKILDKSTKQAVPGTSVSLLNKPDVGATTDTSGKFVIASVPSGSYVLNISAIGYQELQITDVNIVQNKITYLEIEIEETAQKLSEVTVKSYKYENSPRTPVSTYGFSREEISRNPGSQGDIFRAIGMLPGVSANGAEYSAIAVRGQGTRDNIYMVDDIPVTQVSHLEENGSGFNDPNGGRFSIFAPRVIDNAQFQGGGFGAQYGRRSASLLNLAIKTGNPVNPILDGQVDLLGFTINYEGPSYAFKNTSIFASARYQNFGPLIDIINRKDGGLPIYGDYIFKSVTQLGEKNRLSILAVYSPETFTRDVENVKADTGLNYTLLLDAKNDKNIFGINLRTLTGNNGYWRNVIYYTKTKFNYSYGDSYPTVDQNGDITNKENIPYENDLQRIKYSESEIGYRSFFTINLRNRSKLTLGIEAARVDLKNFRRLSKPDTLFTFDHNDFRPSPTTYYSLIDPRFYNADFNDFSFNASSYVDYSFRLFKRLTLNTGIRYDYFGFASQHAISPRLSGSLALNESNTINFAAGIYYQDPVYSEIADQPAGKKLKEEKVYQYILGYKKYFSPDLKLTVEGWYKSLDNLVVRPVSGVSEQNNDGTGWAGGVDINVTKRLSRKIHGQIGYSFLKSKRDDHDGRGEYDFAFEQTHQVNFLIGYKPSSRWILSAKFRYATGKPTSSYIVHADVFDNPNYRRYSQEIVGKNDLHLGDFVVLDVRTDYRFQVHRLGLSAFLDMANINNRLNENRRLFNPIHGRTFVDGLAIFPTFGLKFEY
jgi:hypothetical protein